MNVPFGLQLIPVGRGRPQPRRWLLTLALVLTSGLVHAQSCGSEGGVAVQVLGSGGPIADDDRASSAYLVWVDGKARVLIDVGSGAQLRFAEAGARFVDLDAVLLTHLHADHTADLPALLKSGFFSSRERSLVLAGPSAGGNARVSFPSIEDFLAALLQPGSGAYPYLGGYLDGSDGLPYLRVVTVEIEEPDDDADEDSDEEEEELELTRITLRDSPVQLEAASGSHGPVPAAFYRVSAGGKRIVFAGDHDGYGDALAEFAEDADLLVLHMPIPDGAGRAARALHATPARLGEIADEAGAEHVLLSHFMARSLAKLDENLASLQASYTGETTIGRDLLCLPLP
ncbi:MAG: MBL fold metallo-hydrolase [Pseudomonadota bacterium]